MPRGMPSWPWGEPLRTLELVASLWSAAGLPSAGASAAVPYRALFTTLERLLVGRELTVRLENYDVVMTVTEFSSPLDARALAVGQLGEVRIALEDLRWGQHCLKHVTGVLHNVHFRPGVPPVLVAAPVELSAQLPDNAVGDLLRDAVPDLDGYVLEDGTAQLRWARRPALGSVVVDVDAVGSTLWLKPRALLTGRKRWKLPPRVPGYPLPLPDLPEGLILTNVELRSGAVRLSGVLPEWRVELPLRGVEDIITHLSRAGRSVSLPWPLPQLGS